MDRFCLALTLLGVLAAPARADVISKCGAITADTVLDGDVTASDSCFTIDGPFTLDCKGHTIAGSGKGTAIAVNNQTGVTIRNCAIDDFQVGVSFDGTTNSAVTDSSMSRNGTSVLMHLSALNVLYRLDLQHAIDDAVQGGALVVLLDDTPSNTLNGALPPASVAVGNAQDSPVFMGSASGIVLDGSDFNTISDNLVLRAGTGLFVQGGSQGNVITNNLISAVHTVRFDKAGDNRWSVPAKPGQSIVGGASVAGNVYLSLVGINGASVGCVDADQDGICDDVLHLDPSDPYQNIDSGPLRWPLALPSVTIAAPLDGASYTLGQPVLASYACANAVACMGTVSNGKAIDTSTVSPRAFTVLAADAYGQVAFQTVKFGIGYAVQPLYDPSRSFKRGATAPIKLMLTDAGGNNLSAPGRVLQAVSVTQTTTEASEIFDDAGNANPDDDFRFDAALGGYIFNLKTTGYPTGTFAMGFTVSDDPGATYSTTFQVR
jgi:parallel beta-helix repeat protein